MATPTSDEARIRIEAPPEHVYGLVADLARMGDWSPECRRCDWIDGSTSPAVGARFRGSNRIGPYRWSMAGRVVAADPGREFAFVTTDAGRDGTRWSYRFEPAGSGCEVVESYEVLYEPWYIRLADLFVPRSRQLRRGMEQTLRRIKTAAETTPSAR
jgi:uncharacterized protein YndB with AHSA1/START domain